MFESIHLGVSPATASGRGFPALNEVIKMQFFFFVEPTLPGSFTKSLGHDLATYITLLPKGIACSSCLPPKNHIHVTEKYKSRCVLHQQIYRAVLLSVNYIWFWGERGRLNDLYSMKKFYNE